jgi:biotin-(acetyl-CoA carboxylase) ligase
MKYFEYYYDVLNDADGQQAILEHWQQRSSYFSGKPVRVDLGGSSIEGKTDGLEENGALRVKTTDGSVNIIQAGEVDRLRANT